MYTIFTHTPANHYNKVPGFCLFLKEVPATVLSWHNADGTGKDKGFSCIPVIKPAKTLRCWDSRTVAPNPDAAHNTIKYLPGRKDGIGTIPAPEKYWICCRVTDA